MNSRTLLPLAVAVAGSALLLVGIFANQVGLSHGPIGWTRILLMIVGCGLLAVGLLKRRFLKAYTTTAIMLANTVVLFLGIELTSLVVSRSAGLNSGYQGNTDGQIFAELAASGVAESIYVGPKSLPFQGELLTINENGHRRTPPLEDTGVAPIRVFGFGGSTMWGEGAPDEETVASYLQAMLTERCDYPIQVSNFGQRGWVCSQSLIQLMLELRSGNVPDVVVFYDGYNDVTAAYSTGRIGVPEDVDEIAGPGQSAWQQIARGSQTGRMMGELKPRVEQTVDVERVADAVVANYLSVFRMATALGNEYGFDVQFYWQPHLYNNPKPLTAEEVVLLDHPWLPQPLKDLADAIYERANVAASERDNLSDISDCFREVTERVYLDPIHIRGLGNRVVAETMLDNNLLTAVRNRLQEVLTTSTSL